MRIKLQSRRHTLALQLGIIVSITNPFLVTSGDNLDVHWTMEQSAVSPSLEAIILWYDSSNELLGTEKLTNIDMIIDETIKAKRSERETRIIDHGSNSMEDKKREGYF